MTLAEALLVVLTAMPRHVSDRDEPTEQRLVRLDTIANSIESAVNEATCFDREACKPIYHDRFELAATLVKLGWVESAFASRIHRSECRRHECDNGKAVGIWQTHRLRAWSDETWAALHSDGLAATVFTATHVARLIAGGVGQCGSLAGSLGRFNTGFMCDAQRFELMAKSIQSTSARLRILVAD